MARPRVFVSSTCYDLSEVRDSLVEFIQSFGFDPVLSDRGDVLYDPDSHTHDSCLHEVGNCQMLVLIIGGRFGGQYDGDGDKSKSIVNAEYEAARKHDIPVFTFIKRGVYADHFVYGKNKQHPALNELVFPSIENNKNAIKIFKFIDAVRRERKNNGYFEFDLARDIVDLLRKQWAGMFFEFLQKRSVSDQFEETTTLLQQISSAGGKLEELVEKIYRQVDESGADQTIGEIDKRYEAKRFFEECARVAVAGIAFSDKPAPEQFKNWEHYFAAISDGTINSPEEDVITITWNDGQFTDQLLLFAPFAQTESVLYCKQAERFEKLKTLEADEIRKILLELALLR